MSIPSCLLGLYMTVAAAHPEGTDGAEDTDGWPAAVESVRYTTSADGTKQPALFYAPRSKTEVPLLVGLHTWSSDYRQTSDTLGAPYARWCIEKGWAFIYPNFRGPNRTPEACGSELVVADIASAVDYAKDRVKVDGDRIYLIGASGGGHASLLMAGRKPELWAGVSAWVPIADLEAWHGECRKSGRKYWKDMEAACGGPPGTSATVDAEYRRRSPLTWLEKAGAVAIDINAGIRDGHSGSVPVSHSLRAFNLLAAEKDRVSDADLRYFTDKAQVPPRLLATIDDATYGKKRPLFRRRSRNVRITLFDGGHEIVPGAGLRWLEKQRRRPKRSTRAGASPPPSPSPRATSRPSGSACGSSP